MGTKATVRCALWYAIALAVLTACSPAVPLRLTNEATDSIPVSTPLLPLVTDDVTPTQALLPTATPEVPAPPPSSRLAIIDQSSAVDTDRAGWWSLKALTPIGQTFRPSFAGLDGIELWTEDQWDAECSGVGTSLHVNVRETAIDGSVVGSSLPVVLPNCFKGITVFSFPALVALTPDKVYAIEVVITSQDNWGVVWQQDPDAYGRGESVVTGAVTDADLWFQAGLRDSIPQAEAYCQDGLWQHLKQSDGSAFIDQSDCLQSIPASQ